MFTSSLLRRQYRQQTGRRTSNLFMVTHPKTPGGFEPPSRALQARACPLGHGVRASERSRTSARGSKPAALSTELRRRDVRQRLLEGAEVVVREEHERHAFDLGIR